MFSDDDVKAAMEHGAKAGGAFGAALLPGIAAVMRYTAELLAARGGTMTAEQVRRVTDAMRAGGHGDLADALDEYIAILDARVVVLEAVARDREKDVALALKERDEWRRQCEDGIRDREAVMRMQSEHISDLEKSLENARKEREEAVRTGKQFHADSRKHFDQSCTNLQRAETAERERDAALADNAALVEHARTERQMLSMLYHRIKAMGLRNEALTDAVTTVERWMDAVPDTYEQPHPGAALLERLKRLEERERLWRTVAARLHAAAPPSLRAATEREQADWENAKGEYYALRDGH